MIATKIAQPHPIFTDCPRPRRKANIFSNYWSQPSLELQICLSVILTTE